MAAAGHFVFIPEIPEWSSFRIAPAAALQTIRAAVHTLHERADIDRERIGLFAFSFGGTQSLIAASDPEVARELRGVVSWGGYESVQQLVRFGFTGEHELDGVRYQVEPDPYGRWLVGGNFLTRVGGCEHMDDVARALLELAEEAGKRGVYAGDPQYDPFKAELAARFTGEKLRMFDVFAPRGRILGADRTFARELIAPISETVLRAEPLMDPGSAFSTLRVRTYLAHGRDDRLIPFTESVRAGRRISKDVLAGTAITGLFAHSGGTSSSLSAGGKVREGARFLSVLDRALGLI
jgi:pimeloyl-ACP methyl ester carboxylesterase